MDLLQTVRKEGSRGGVNFSWDDVKNSQHRENYLGHSVMAPVGRWQQNRDLSWYAKAGDADLTPEERAEKEKMRKKEEMRTIKEAEEDAMLKAMGLPVPDRTNANEEPLGMSKEKQQEMNKALKAALGDDDREDGGAEEVSRRSRSKDGHRRRRRSRSRTSAEDDQDRNQAGEIPREGIDTTEPIVVIGLGLQGGAKDGEVGSDGEATSHYESRENTKIALAVVKDLGESAGTAAGRGHHTAADDTEISDDESSSSVKFSRRVGQITSQ